MVFDVEDFSTALIRFGSGLSISLDVSWACHTDAATRNDVVLYGSEAGASVFPARLYRPSDAGDYQIIENPAAGMRWPQHCRFAHFADAVLGRCAPAVGLDEALAVQSVLDGIYRFAASGVSEDVGVRRLAARAA